MWFKHDTVLVMMIALLKIMEQELDKAAFRVIGQRVKANLERVPQKRALAKAQALFFKALKEAGGNEAKVRAFYGNLQISFLVEVGPQGQRELAANHTREGEGHANEVLAYR